MATPNLLESTDQLHEAMLGLRGLCSLLASSESSLKPELIYHVLRPLVDAVAAVDGQLQAGNRA